jgi:hypothetical protein
LVEKHNSKLIIACLDESSKYYGFFCENKFSWCMTGVSRSEQKPEGGYRWTLHPFDGHPTSEANDRYAESVHAAIEEELLGTHAEPGPGTYPKDSRPVEGQKWAQDSLYPLF